MAREAAEEAGLTLRPEELNVYLTVARQSRPGLEYLDVFLRLTPGAGGWDGEFTNLEPEKCRDLRLFPLTGLPANTLDHVRFAVTAGARPFVEENFVEWTLGYRGD